MSLKDWMLGRMNHVVTRGDLVITPPLERHAFRALADAELIAFCSGPRAGSQYETDTFKLEVPISGRSRPAGRRSRKP